MFHVKPLKVVHQLLVNCSPNDPRRLFEYPLAQSDHPQVTQSKSLYLFGGLVYLARGARPLHEHKFTPGLGQWSDEGNQGSERTNGARCYLICRFNKRRLLGARAAHGDILQAKASHLFI